MVSVLSTSASLSGAMAALPFFSAMDPPGPGLDPVSISDPSLLWGIDEFSLASQTASGRSSPGSATSRTGGKAPGSGGKKPDKAKLRKCIIEARFKGKMRGNGSVKRRFPASILAFWQEMSDALPDKLRIGPFDLLIEMRTLDWKQQRKRLSPSLLAQLRRDVKPPLMPVPGPQYFLWHPLTLIEEALARAQNAKLGHVIIRTNAAALLGIASPSEEKFLELVGQWTGDDSADAPEDLKKSLLEMLPGRCSPRVREIFEAAKAIEDRIQAVGDNSVTNVTFWRMVKAQISDQYLSLLDIEHLARTAIFKDAGLLRARKTIKGRITGKWMLFNEALREVIAEKPHATPIELQLGILESLGFSSRSLNTFGAVLDGFGNDRTIDSEDIERLRNMTSRKRNRRMTGKPPSIAGAHPYRARMSKASYDTMLGAFKKANEWAQRFTSEHGEMPLVAAIENEVARKLPAGMTLKDALNRARASGFDTKPFYEKITEWNFPPGFYE